MGGRQHLGPRCQQRMGRRGSDKASTKAETHRCQLSHSPRSQNLLGCWETIPDTPTKPTILWENSARCQLRSPWGSLGASQASHRRGRGRGRILGQNMEVTKDTDMGRDGQSELSALTTPATAGREGASADQAAEPSGSANKLAPSRPSRTRTTVPVGCEETPSLPL